MSKFLALVMVCLIASCAVKENKVLNKDNGSILVRELSRREISRISLDWKNDSLGCMGLRKADSIELLINQRGLINQHEDSIVRYLGKPNHISTVNEKETFIYFLECGEPGKMSYSNFYCHFDSLQKLESVIHAIF